MTLVLTACGGGAPSVDDVAPEDAPRPASGDVARLHIVVTTSILGDIVRSLVEDAGQVDVVMPAGADPHGFQPSAQDAAMLREADLVVANGLDLEEPLADALDAAASEGVRVFTLADKLDPIVFDADDDDAADDHADDHADDDHADDHADHDHADHDHADDDHADDDHADDDHADDDDADGPDEDGGHDHGPEDPHVWFDPVRMATGVRLLADELADVDPAGDDAAWESRGEAQAATLLQLDAEIEDILDDVPPERRQLITNHEALGYFAARYDFEVIGTVIPGTSTQAATDAGGFAALVDAVEAANVRVIFAENTDSTTLAEQLAREVAGGGDLEIEVVRIHTDALGEAGSGAETYPGLLRTTANRIAEALG